MEYMNKGVIYISRTNLIVRKHWLVLITLLLGLSIPLFGCSSLTTKLSNQATPTSAVPNPAISAPIDTTTPSDKTISSTPTDTNTTLTKSQTVSQSAKTGTPTKTNERKNTVAISKVKYNQLNYGYTYEKVKSLLVDTGEVLTESGIKGSKGYTVTYVYHVKSPSSGEVFLAFKDDKLVNKMEVNLQ